MPPVAVEAQGPRPRPREPDGVTVEAVRREVRHDHDVVARAAVQPAKASRPVILRRLLDTGVVSRSEFDQIYSAILSQTKPAQAKSSVETSTTRSRSRGQAFVRTLAASTAAGHTLYREAFQLS